MTVLMQLDLGCFKCTSLQLSYIYPIPNPQGTKVEQDFFLGGGGGVERERGGREGEKEKK